MKISRRLTLSRFLTFWAVSAGLLASSSSHAATLLPSDGASGDHFGSSVSVSSGIGLVGSSSTTVGGNSAEGTAYVYDNLATATGTTYQSAELFAFGAGASSQFGSSVALSGSLGLIGAVGVSSNQGAAYVYDNITTATGTTYQSAVLLASDGSAGNYFGYATSISGSVGLVGAIMAGNGAAYVYDSLNTASGTTYQNAKLVASDGSSGSYFGAAVSVSGNVGIVGAHGAKGSMGEAYVYDNLTTATGTTTQNAELFASGEAGPENFGYAVSVSGNIGLVGAIQALSNGTGGLPVGAVYVYDNLSTASGTTYQNAKLMASDSVGSGDFGYSVSVSGSTGLVGALAAGNSPDGAAYLYLNLPTSGTMTQDVEIFASTQNVGFGASVSLDGDQFVIGEPTTPTVMGQSFAGSVSSMTTLDAGNASETISGISFISQDNWVIGRLTNSNTVTLSAGNSASVSAGGKAVFIGQNSASNGNRLVVQGTLTGTGIYVGATGNSGNTLELDDTGTFNLSGGAIYLATGNYLSIEGDYTSSVNLFSYLSGADASLDIWNGSSWETVNAGNYSTLISSSYTGGFTSIEAVPEPSVWLLMGAGGVALLVWNRRPGAPRRS